MLMSLPNSVGIDPASANEDVFKASGRLVLPKQARWANGGVPVRMLSLRTRVSMLMSLPNLVGIDPARANDDVFKASGRLVLPHQLK